MKILLLLLFFGTVADQDPTFKQISLGWQPECPANTTFVHRKQVTSQVPLVLAWVNNCRWKNIMGYKPTQDEFKCVDNKVAKKLPTCSKKEHYK